MVDTIKSETCQFLPWDSDFFGVRIARVNNSHLDEITAREVLKWCEKNSIQCLYFLSEADNHTSIRTAEKYQFKMVEIRINFERSLKDWDPNTRPHTVEGVMTRCAQPEDIPILLSIARTAYVDSRYYFDERFSEEHWQAYYATWVKKSFSGGAQIALVAEKDGEVVGYITGLINPEKPTEGQYELTGVLDSARKVGVGQELFRAGLDEYVRRGVDYIWVATQGRNITTQRMIEKHSFLTKSCQIYYHKWFDE